MEGALTASTILVVEDEADMARILQANLTCLGHTVRLAASGAEADRQIEAGTPDLVLLDLRLPDAFGTAILRRLKAAPATADVPVIVVSALGDEEIVVQALNLGAEDYVAKPFRTQELLARVAGALRRWPHGSGAERPLNFGPIAMDRATREVRVGGAPVEFTRSEFGLLAYFVENAGRALTREQLCEHALGRGGSILERTIDAHVRTIRRKLGDAGRCIITVWGIGYRLVLKT